MAARVLLLGLAAAVIVAVVAVRRPVVAWPASGTAWAVAALILVGVALPVLRLTARAAARYTLFRHAAAMTAQHLTPLLRRRAQLVTPDPYGKPQFARWEKEIDYFIAEHIAPSLTASEQRALERHYSGIANLVSDQVEAVFDAQPSQREFTDDMTPAQYETFCAEQLRLAGWTARVTMHSRDQGVDVVAEKDQVRIVVQCKLYARPVGNKSVQEAAAGRAHEDADFAVVVSNNRFTPAAEQLAASNGVLLLHHRDLQAIDTLLPDRG